MKNPILTLLAGLFVTFSVFASNNPVTKETKSGQSIEVEVVEEGEINLYTHETTALLPYLNEDPLGKYTTTTISFYIAQGDQELIEVHCANYKKVLRNKMSDNAGLASLIGQRGYKFEDLDTIISSYNKD